MAKRFVSIWFRYLRTDWFCLRQPHFKNVPFVLRTAIHGRMVITAANLLAEKKNIHPGMVLADARAIFPDLKVEDDIPDLPEKLLRKLAEWCIRFTPIVAVDLPDGIFFDASGCAHLWGGEKKYLDDIIKKLTARGYHVRASIADTPALAWAVARFGKGPQIVCSDEHINTLLPLPPESLRLEPENLERLHKLGLHQIGQFMKMPRSALRRRFGQHFITRLDMMLGLEMEILQPVVPVEEFQERLPCLEPIVTATGIEIAIQELLKKLCSRLQQKQKGLRTVIFKCYRVDGKIEQIEIITNRPTYNVGHLLKLFAIKLPAIEPDMGIELFVLDAPKTEDHLPMQERMWESSAGLEDIQLSELIDRLAIKIGSDTIRRYLPDEHYWPERSFKIASSLQEPITTLWPSDRQRPLQILQTPEPIDVTAPIPDYPPMLFHYRGKLHKVVRADGPERIEQEWWIQNGQHRDYYRVEDENGNRYWIFRLGHYHDKTFKWFLHGFFS